MRNILVHGYFDIDRDAVWALSNRTSRPSENEWPRRSRSPDTAHRHELLTAIPHGRVRI